MSHRVLAGLGVGAGLIAVALTWQRSHSHAQQLVREQAATDAAKGGKFEFEVVESFDAQYLGDTPGHRGRNGGLDKRRPRLALGDPVLRGNEKVGMLTQITWDRTGGSLDLEFDPTPLARVNVGDVVWVALDGSKPAVEKP